MMKLFLCLVFNLLVLSLVAEAQKIPKDADAIELTTSLADSALFESVQSYLEEAGFDIEIANQEDGTIVTEYRLIAEFKTIKEPIEIRITATLSGEVVLFKAQATSHRAGNSYENEPIVNKESADGVSNGEFLLFNEVITKYAKTLDQVTVDYNVP
ncbi:hypothetical protein [Spirosoma agri]|uniref:Uncharacterized protein n=1 Tax=Spirosoma agri TaxID=1987381 RepID=A0A6M0IDX8_9BACT|nr:hypothetical protein [Spirosoma agri]NEU65965.1 hypothetical protein [Spirosoma agri]